MIGDQYDQIVIIIKSEPTPLVSNQHNRPGDACANWREEVCIIRPKTYFLHRCLVKISNVRLIKYPLLNVFCWHFKTFACLLLKVYGRPGILVLNYQRWCRFWTNYQRWMYLSVFVKVCFIGQKTFFFCIVFCNNYKRSTNLISAFGRL